MGHAFLRLVLDVVEQETQLLVGLDVVRVQLQRLAVLRNGVVGVAVAVELVAGPDEGVVVEELLADLGDRVGARR